MPTKRKAEFGPSSATIGYEAKLWFTGDRLRSNWTLPIAREGNAPRHNATQRFSAMNLALRGRLWLRRWAPEKKTVQMALPLLK